MPIVEVKFTWNASITSLDIHCQEEYLGLEAWTCAPAKPLLSDAKPYLNVSKTASLVLPLLTKKWGKLENLFCSPVPTLSEISVWY